MNANTAWVYEMSTYRTTVKKAFSKLVGEGIIHPFYGFVITNGDSREKVALRGITGHFTEETAEVSKAWGTAANMQRN